MGPENTGTATEPIQPTPAPAESGTGTSGTDNQKNDVQNQVVMLQKTLEEIQKANEVILREKQEAQALALQNEAKYRGFQQQVTKTLQQAAEDRRALEQLRQSNFKTAEFEEMLEAIANRVLDEDERKDLKFRQREAKVKLAEQAVAASQEQIAQSAAPSAASPSYQSPEDAKAQFLNDYFPGSGIDPKDTRLDWGEGATGAEAFKRFTNSVVSIQNARSQDEYAKIQKQTQDALDAFKSQQEEIQKKTEEEISKAKQEAIDAARKDSEKKLRALGADVSGTPSPEPGSGTPSGKSLMDIMNEQLDDSLLTTPKGRQEYDRRLRAITSQVRGR